MNKWPLARIGDVCDLVNGRAFKPTDWTDNGLPIVRIQNLNDHSKPFNRFDGKVAEKILINNGDVLLSWSGTPGTSFGCFVWQRGSAILNQHIFKVQIDAARLDRDYFVHAVNSKLGEMISLAHGGVGLRHITKGKLEGIKLPVPPLTEQRRIVAHIKECMDRIDELRQLREEAEHEAIALLPSSLALVFTDLRNICESVPIGDVLIDSRYGTSRKCNADDDMTPVLRIPNVAHGMINFDNLKFCNLDAAELKRLALSPGDLLIVRTNGSADLVGRCAVFDQSSRPFAFASYLIRLRVARRMVEPHFVAFFLSSTAGRDAIAAIRRTSAGQYNINSENLRSIKIPVPSLPEQRRVVERLQQQQRVSLAVAAEQAAPKGEAGHLRAAVLRTVFAAGG